MCNRYRRRLQNSKPNVKLKGEPKKMITKIAYFELNCDHCKKTTDKFKNHQEARKKGWAIARDRKTCYCPKCAYMYRYGVTW